MATSTSFRLSEAAKSRLGDRAQRDGISATALLDRLITEGIDQLDHPGIIFRGPLHDRRPALAAGPDVWEIVARLQDLEGGVEARISDLADETELNPRLIRLALDYAAEHADDVSDRIRRNREAVERSEQAARARAALIA